MVGGVPNHFKSWFRAASLNCLRFLKAECKRSPEFLWAACYSHFNPRSSARKCSMAKVFLKIPQSSKENTSAGVSFFNKSASRGNATLSKRDSGTGIFLWISGNVQQML